MKHRFLMTAMASIMLASGVGAASTAVAPTQTVQAVSKHSYRWHWVKVKRDVKVYRLRLPLYRAPKFDSIMEKGSDAEVRYIPNHYYFELKGYAKHGRYAVMGTSARWFRNEND